MTQKPSLLRVLLFISILAMAGSWIPEWISVTITPSLRRRIYLLDRAPTTGMIKHNSYILFQLNSVMIKDAKTNKIIKKVACIEGDELVVRELYYYCNEKYLGQAKEYSLDGKKLKSFPFEGVIPKGMLFVFSNHVDSYDSRYFGFVEKKDVLAIVHPII